MINARISQPAKSPRWLSVFSFVVALLASAAAYAEEALPDEAAFPRVRAGVSCGLGKGDQGIAGALGARIGAQWTSFLATSYQLTAAATEEHLLLESSDYAHWTSHALLVELMVPSTMLILGAGPAYIRGNVGRDCFFESSCNEWSTPLDRLGYDMRLAYAIGINWPRRRLGGIIELAAHSAGHSWATTLSVGVDVF